MAELQEKLLIDFTGGLNLRRSQYSLAENESPEMLNVEIDPRGGFYTRRGWSRWNAADATDPEDWHPRNICLHPLSDGAFVVYVANNGTILEAGTDGSFADLSIACSGAPHLADFASWGDTLYMACGSNEVAYKRHAEDAAVMLLDAAAGFNDDYTIPADGRFPAADFCEAHAGYMFVAYTEEGGTTYPNRIRWSHPGQPEDWATLDYIDIEVGGGRITALMSFQDHLLIFKTDSVWALYGYNTESWQLIRVSRRAGTSSTAAVTSSETAVYFYSPTNQGGIFAYTGESPVDIGEAIRPALSEVSATDDVFIGWTGRRLWCSVPWLHNEAREGDETTALVFDPQVGNGAWVSHRSAVGSLTAIAGGSEVTTEYPLAAVCGHSGAACLVRLEYLDRAEDILDVGLTADPFTAKYFTGWKDMGTDRRKSWRRPRISAVQQTETVGVKVNSFKDYNEASPIRSHTFLVSAEGNVFWRLNGSADDSGADWGDGSMWGAATAQGARLVRPVAATEGSSGLGVNRALQLEFTTDNEYAGRQWGVNGITLKYLLRKLTT